MKGVSFAIVVVVTAIVVLIVALVVLTIFGSGITPVRTIAEATNLCTTMGNTACASTGNLPLTWEVASVSVAGTLKSCKDVFTGQTCTCSAAGKLSCT